MDGLGTCVLEHRTGPCILWPHAKKTGASALPVLPAVAKQEGEMRKCVIATGLWVPLRFHSVAPKVPFCLCSVVVYSAWLCSRVRTHSHWESGLG